MTHSRVGGNATYGEIVTQFEAWNQALDVTTNLSREIYSLWNSKKFTQVIFTGCGSTYYLSLAAAALTQQLLGTAARAVPAGELVINPDLAYVDGAETLLVAVSRSAETTETVEAVRYFRAHCHGSVIVISNHADRLLSNAGEINLIVPAGQEQSVAQTRSFASMYVASVALATLFSRNDFLVKEMDRLPDVGRRLLQEGESIVREIGMNLDFDRFYFLGSGLNYGLACEVNLKMKEMSLTHSEPFHFLEFRHGPISMVGPTTVITGLLSEKNRLHEQAVLQNSTELGAHCLTLAENEADLSFHSLIPEAVRGVLYLPLLQLLAYYRAQAKQLNPDQPTNLNAVVKLNW